MTILFLIALTAMLAFIAGRYYEHVKTLGLVCEHCRKPVAECSCMTFTPEDE